MKSILLFVILGCAAAFGKNGVTVVPISYGGEFAVGVTVDADIDADEAIVTIFYKRSSSIGDLLLTGTSVVPAINGAAAMSDVVPVAADKVTRVEVILVKRVLTTSFAPGEFGPQD